MIVALLAVAAYFILSGVAWFALAVHANTQRRLHAAYRAHVMLSEAKRFASRIKADEANQANFRG